MTKLNKYLEERGIKKSWLAEKVGISKTRMALIVNHGSLPSLGTAIKIEEITEGKVTVNDLINSSVDKVKVSTKNDTLETYSKNAEFMIKKASRQMMTAAIKKGFLKKPLTCEACGLEKKLDGHHEDYSKPTCVQWLCRRCHRRVHTKISKRIKMELEEKNG